VKEPLRILLKERELSKIRWQPVDYDDARGCRVPETTRLAKTIQI
jgi:hypothetical protein